MVFDMADKLISADLSRLVTRNNLSESTLSYRDSVRTHVGGMCNFADKHTGSERFKSLFAIGVKIGKCDA